MPIIQGATVPQEPSGVGMLLETVLNSATAYHQGKQDKAYRLSAAKILGVDPSGLAHFKREEIKELIKKKKFEPQEWKPTTKEEALDFEKAKAGFKTKEQDMGKNLVRLLGGLAEPETVFTPEQIKESAPLSAGPTVEGGQVLETSGYPGEYLPGYEPKPEPAAIADLLRQKLGINKEEAQRHALGLPKKEAQKDIAPSTAVGILADSLKSAQIKKMYPEFFKKLERIAKAKQDELTNANEIIDENW